MKWIKINEGDELPVHKVLAISADFEIKIGIIEEDHNGHLDCWYKNNKGDYEILDNIVAYIPTEQLVNALKETV